VKALPLINASDKLAKSQEDPPMLNSLDNEWAVDYSGQATMKRLRLKSVREEVRGLASLKFPLPKTLSRQQWKRLVDLGERDLRTRYLDAVARDSEGEAYPELSRMSELCKKGFVFTKENIVPFWRPEEGDCTLEEHLERLQSVHDHMRYEGESTPLEIKETHWRELAEARSKNRMVKLLRYLGEKRHREFQSFVEKRIRQESYRVAKESGLANPEVKHIKYGLGDNTILLRYYSSNIERQLQWFSVREHNEWGQPVVLDMQFAPNLQYREAKSLLTRQICIGLRENRRANVPLAVHLCNFAGEKCQKSKLLLDSMPGLTSPDSDVVTTERCYTELFPKERLVYLTPDSSDFLPDKPNPEDVYVLGGLVGGGFGMEEAVANGLSLATAKEDGIRHAKLPLKRYVGISPQLHVDQVSRRMIEEVVIIHKSVCRSYAFWRISSGRAIGSTPCDGFLPSISADASFPHPTPLSTMSTPLSTPPTTP